MYVNRRISIKIIYKFAIRNVLIFTLYGAFVIWLYDLLNHGGIDIAIPFLPVSTIGIAVALYTSFKNNQSYDRFWEARKIWGGIVNYSRTWGNQILSFATLDHDKNSTSQEELKSIQEKLIYRQIAWINALRLQLRRPSKFSKNYGKHTRSFYKGEPQGEQWRDEVGIFIKTDDEREHYKNSKNVATMMVRRQGEDLKKLCQIGLIEDFRHMELNSVLTEFYNLQGKCERINNTPLPRQYAYFSEIFTWIFILILPFGLVGEFQGMGHGFLWLTLPFYILIAWIFMTMEIVGDNSEDPFENYINDVPMTALCRTIEIDLRSMLGETDLPDPIKDEDGILM